MINCTRCAGTGFLNIHQLPDDVDGYDFDAVDAWWKANTGHDVQPCDCCGDGEGWYGVPGQHYSNEDPRGYDGPYAYNGGLCECH